MNDEAYISLQEASTLLGVSSATLRNWDRSGKLKSVRHPVNRYRMYRLSEVVALENKSSLFPVATPLQTLADEITARRQPPTITELRRLVKAINRILRDGEGNSSLIERFDELTKILYCKVQDEKSTRNGSGGGAFRLSKGDSNRTVAHRVRKVFRDQVAENRSLFPERFCELRISDSTLRQIVEMLGLVEISASREDLKGVVYEEVIRNTFDKGDNQQFFTPRAIIEFMVEMLGGALTGTVCDPACGTGGFLLYVDRVCRERSKRRSVDLIGFEIDDRLAWAAGINLHMHDAARFSIERLDGAGTLGSEVRRYFGVMDAIVTNPPFGSDLTDREALAKFELGRGRQSRRRGVLFVERCLDLLKPGGVLAIVIDESVLNGPSNADTRRLILERSDPVAVVSLPETTFMPYASVKTSVLFLQKRGGRQPRLQRDAETFFGDAVVVGKKPNGDPLFRISKATGRQELDSDLPVILNAWRNEAGRSNGATVHGEHVFWSRIPDLRERSFDREGHRLDLSFHHPARADAIQALQSSTHPLRSIGDICTLRNEGVVPSKDLVDEDITYVGLANIEARTGVCSPIVVNGGTLKSSVKRFIGGDILYAKMRPELRKACLIPSEVDEGFASSECLVLALKRDRSSGKPLMLPELLALLLRSDLVYGQIVHLVIGIGRPRVSKSAVLNVKVPLPPDDEQQRLLRSYQRAEADARLLLEESERAFRRSQETIADARKQLLGELLGKGRPGVCRIRGGLQ